MPCRALEQSFESRKHSRACPSLMKCCQLCTPLSVFSFHHLWRRHCPTFWDLACRLDYCEALELSVHTTHLSLTVWCASFNFPVHSSEVFLKTSLTQSVLSEVWLAIQLGCFQIWWLTFCICMWLKNWCDFIKIKEKECMSLFGTFQFTGTPWNIVQV